MPTKHPNLAAALIAAQQAFDPIKDDKSVEVVNREKGTKYTYTYATMTAVLEATTEALHENGLVIAQAMDFQNGMPCIKTMLMHADSDDEIISMTPVVYGTQNDPRSYGGGITYARRYALMAILNLNAEDDDGAAAMPAQRPPQQSLVSQVQNRDQRPSQGTTASSGGTSGGPSEPQMNMINRLLAKIHGSGFEKNDEAVASMRGQLKDWFDISSRKQLTPGRDGTASAYIGFLKYIAGEDGGVEPPGGMPSVPDDGLPF